MSEKWYLVTSQNKPLVPDMVLQAVEPNSVLTDNGGKVPIDAMIKWGYKLIPVQVLPMASGNYLRWDDERIKDITFFVSNMSESNKTIDVLKLMRDEYEQERKDKIFIPAELRGCLLSTIQKAKDLLVHTISRLEEIFPEDERRIHSVERKIEGWKIEIAEYDEVLKALIGEPDVQEKIPE